MRVSAQLGAGGDAAGGGVAHLWPACGLEGWKRREAERSSGSDGSPDPSEQTPPASTIPAAQEVRPHSSVLSWLPPALCGGLSPGMDSHFYRCSSRCAPAAAGSTRADMALRGASLRPAQMSAGGFRCRLAPGTSRISAGAAGRGREWGGEGYEMGDENPRKRFRFRRLIRLLLWLLDFKYKEKKTFSDNKDNKMTNTHSC